MFDISAILRQKFDGQPSFTKNELEDLLKSTYAKSYQNATYRWRIHDLKERGIIENVARGVYALPGKHKEYIPEVSNEIISLHKKVYEKLPFTDFSFTDGRWYNEFMIHQVFRTYLILEVEKGAMESVYHFVDDEDRMIYFNPTREQYERFIINNDRNRPLVINNLVSEAPLSDVNGVKTASLEKLLVDCVADESPFAAQQEETEGIFKSAFEKYSVSIPKLQRYAQRRNRKKQIDELIKNVRA